MYIRRQSFKIIPVINASSLRRIAQLRVRPSLVCTSSVWLALSIAVLYLVDQFDDSFVGGGPDVNATATVRLFSAVCTRNCGKATNTNRVPWRVMKSACRNVG